ncbi:MAG: ThuA domain-containing protein [Turicibacter sp.]|nr:ThuA domain-containing protein [Turicibacter sp.]
MRILLFCDEHYHPGQVVIDGMSPLKAKGYNFDIIKNGRDFQLGMLQDYEVVVMTKCDEATPEDRESWKSAEIQREFVEFVENGGGLLFVHSGLVAGKDTAIMDSLAGARFKWHPKDSAVWVEPIKPHPIVDGVRSFCEVDEHYYLENVADDVDIIMASYSPSQGVPEKYESEPYTNAPAKLEPAGYVRTQGKGRICGLTPGHHLHVWLNENFQKLLENSLQWCANKS